MLTLRNGYQKEIDKAIHRAEAAERQSKEKDAVIDRQRKQIGLLDRMANPQRYSLSSGAELVRINVSNYRNPSLHIWTRVGEELYEDIKFQIDYDVAQKHFNGQITDEEFVNAIFEPQEQVSGKQAELLGAAFILAAGGPAEAHVGTGGGGSSSDLPWRDEDKDKNKNRNSIYGKKRRPVGGIKIGHYKIFCVNGKYGIQREFRIFYFIDLQNEEDYERKESSSAR